MKLRKRVPEKSSHDKHHIQKGLIISVILTILIIFSAGCVNDDKPITVETKDTNVPPDMAESLRDVISDLKNSDISMSIDMYNLAGKIGKLDSIEYIRETMLKYYEDNVWIEKLIYYDLADGTRIRVPELSSDVYMSDYLPVPSQAEIEAAGGIFHVDCVYIPGDGYVNANYAAVYDEKGKYKGFIILIYDFYAALNFHPMILDEENEYGKYACVITDKSNRVIFSTAPEYIGETISEESPLNTGKSYVVPKDSQYGAYAYKSNAFYNYMWGTETEKITSWQKFTTYKNTYTLYLIGEINQPEMVYDNVYTIDIETTVKMVQETFVYSSSHSKKETLNKINNGDFSPFICAMDMEGNLLSIIDDEVIGLNYINNRDTYGTSYVESMIFTAQQGGGYVYYSYSVEPTISPRGSQFSMGYIIPVDSDWFIYGRFTGDTDILPTDYALRSDVTAVSRAVAKEAFELGSNEVITKINNNPGSDGKLFVSSITKDVSDIGVSDLNGFIYADSMYPELTGSIQTGYTDVYGGSTMRKMIMLAKAGGGLMNDIRESETEGCVDLWLYAVEPIDNFYFVQTGVVIATYKDYLSEYLNK